MSDYKWVNRDPNHVYTEELMRDLGIKNLVTLKDYIESDRIPKNINYSIRIGNESLYWLRDKFYRLNNKIYTYEHWKTKFYNKDHG